MDNSSKMNNQTNRRLLLIEELEERIAPVTVDADHWVIGAADNPLNTIHNAYPVQTGADWYWIFYVGPGSAHITGDDGTVAGSESLNGHHILNITVTGSTMDSALFVMDFPGDPTPAPTGWPIPGNAGTLQVHGDITVGSIGVPADLGYLAVDGVMYGWTTVYGTLGKFDVGALDGNLTVHGDLWELDVDSTLGAAYHPPAPPTSEYWDIRPTAIAVDGNIGAIRVGVGLSDGGQSVNNMQVLGGIITGFASIRANADGLHTPGTIDLIEVLAGSQNYGPSSPVSGSLGFFDGDLPSISAGHGGNVRFIHIDGDAYWNIGGIGTAISQIVVTSASLASEKTIVDDSGGVLTIKPQNPAFVNADGSITMYTSAVEYLVIPVDRGTQGPGAVIARMILHGSNTLNVTGNVEIGSLEMGTDTVYSEGALLDRETILAQHLVTSIDELQPTDWKVLTQLQGYAHDTVSGTGQCDIYYLNAMSTYNDHSQISGSFSNIIPIFVNSTVDGDIANVASDGDIIYLGAHGKGADVGLTESITGQPLRGPMPWEDGDVAWVDTQKDLTSDSVSPWGIEGSLTRYNSMHGIFINVGDVYAVRATGAIGDVRAVNGNIRFVQADSNNIHDGNTMTYAGSWFYLSGSIMECSVPFLTYFDHSVSPFGKGGNSLGEATFGRMITGTGTDFRDAQDRITNTGGFIAQVEVGDGLQEMVIDVTNAYPLSTDHPTSPYPSNSGIFISSGVYSRDYVGLVHVSGENKGIFGSVVGQYNNPLTGTAVNVSATNGAVIEGTGIDRPWVLAGGVGSNIWRVGFSLTGNVGVVSATGPTAEISNFFIAGYGVNKVAVSGANDAHGMFDDTIYGSQGAIRMVSSDGRGIDGCTIAANGVVGTVQTTGKASIISNSSIQALSGLQTLVTHALDGDNIYAVTIGKLAKMDYIQDTTFDAGGIRSITVKGDVTGSTLRVAGPLDLLSVGGNISGGCTIESTGVFGQINKITVKGAISNTSILSTGGIYTVTAGGGISADLLAESTTGMANISAKGTITGNWSFAHPVASIKTGAGNIDADISALSIGALSAAVDITGTINATGDVGKITAGGNIGESAEPTSISAGGTVGAIQAKGGIYADIAVTHDIQSIKAGGNLGNDTLILTARSIGTIAVGAGKSIGDIKSSITTSGDATVSGDIKSIKASGSITGDLNVAGNLGTLAAAGAVSGSIDVGGSAKSIKTGGSISAANFSIGVDLGSLVVGSSKSPAQVLSDIDVGRDLGTLSVLGGLPGDLTVGRDAKSIAVGGNAGHSGGMFTINGNLGNLKVGTLGTAALVAGLDVGGNVTSVVVNGEIDADMEVDGTVNTINTTQMIKANITIHGDLGSISSGSSFEPGTPPVDYWIISGHDTFALTVDGLIKKIPV